ncbi:MAG: N-6 DNA methylase [Oscillibacter sp.]|nr:N-6 DNA methylase [Oscillibacter sp.]
MINIRKLESELWESADLLRAGSKLTSNQYCMPVLGLIFLRYAYSRFKMVEAEILKNRPVRGGRVLPVEASDFASKSALFLPKEAQYEYLVNLPADIASAGLSNQSGHTMNSLGEVVNNAMELVEAQSEQLTGVLPKDYTMFSDELLGELLRIFNNSALDEVGGDIIGRIYEYFLNKFAKNIAQDDGVFFTPKSLVKMIVNVLEPSGGVLLDPACGSGGMFVQTGDFVNAAGMEANSAMTFYGQEKVEYNAQLCLMNMAVHGLTGVIKSGDEANTFYHDAHNLDGCCDYVMANPPFNVDKVNSESAQSAGRLPFGLPSVNAKKEFGNANYLWISYFYSYLNENGRAGFVMASSATDSSGKDRDIRQQLVESGHVDVMVSVGNNFFYTKSLPCSLWFFDKGKTEAMQDKVLFLDARNYYTVVDRTLNEWSEWQLKNLNAIVWLYRGEVDKYHALLKEYQAVLGGELPFVEKVAQLTGEITALRAEAKQAVEEAAKREKKKVQAEYDERITALEETLTVAKEAVWLYEKFGEGKYDDIPGLCKVASCAEIEEKNYSLTPGAYVGVAAVEDDGVDFAQRMGEIHRELLALQAESNDLMQTISRNMKEMGL